MERGGWQRSLTGERSSVQSDVAPLPRNSASSTLHQASIFFSCKLGWPPEATRKKEGMRMVATFYSIAEADAAMPDCSVQLL
jgi:hypothetical protein